MFYIMMYPKHYSVTLRQTAGMETGNDSAIFQGHDSRMISIDQLKTYP